MTENSRKERLIRPGDTVIIYKDTEREQEIEGYAHVWEVLETYEEHLVLYVSFMGDPKQRKVTRDYRRWERL